MKKRLLIFAISLLSFVGSSVHAQSYCAAGPTTSFDSEITGVIISGDNYSISRIDASCGPQGVQDFTATDSADLSIGTSYTLDVTMGTCSGNYAGAISAWIDFNGDGDFDDADEQLGVFAGTPTITLQWTFSVPGTAVLGQSVLRVMQEENASSTTISPCNTFAYGSVEDYRINITNTPPACPNPSNLSVTTGANDASLTWDGAANYYIVEYDPSGFTPGTGDTVWVSTDSVFLTNLMSSTSYDFYVSGMCTSGPSTGAVTALNVFTQCGIVTAPFTENFDGWSGNIPPCWNGIKTSTSGFGWTWDGFGTGSTGTGPSSGNSGDYYLYLETSSGTPPAPSYVELPVLDLTATPNAQLKYAYHMYGASMGVLQVEVSTDNITWDTLSTKTGQQQAASGDPYMIETLSLANYISTTTYIRFSGERGTSFTGDMAIDDIYVGDCPGASSVAVSSITGNSATISWTSAATDHSIEYGPVGFGQGTGMVLAPATSPATISGLTGSTTYDFYIKDSCSATSLAVAGPFQFTTTQGMVSVPYYEGFEAGTGDFLSSGNNNSWEYGAPSGVVITSAAQGTKAWVTKLNGVYNNNEESSLLTPYFDNTAGTFDLVYEFDMALATEFSDETWVEYSFDDSLWIKLTAGPISNNWYNDTQNQWWDGDTDPSWTNRLAVVPNSAGKVVHFRHRFSSNAFVQREGVGIDELNVYEIPCEFPVTDLASSNSTATSFDLHWMSNASSWEIETGPVGYGQATGVGTIINVSNDTATISIGACDSVDVYVRAACDTSLYSPWVGPLTVGALCEYDLRLNDLIVAMNTCGDSATTVQAVVENKGMFSASNFAVNANITGGISSQLSMTYADTLLSGESDTVLVGTFNTSAGATNVDIVGYTSLTGDQYTANDSISYDDVGYIGLLPQVASNDTICETDAFGVLYAEPIEGLTYGWYASPTDSVAIATGDSFVVPNPGQLTWYLGYEAPSAFIDNGIPATGNSGDGHTFSIMPNQNLSIKGLDLNFYNFTAPAGTAVDVTISYRLGAATAANSVDPSQWTLHETVSVISAGQGNPTYVGFSSPIKMASGTMHALRIEENIGDIYAYQTSGNPPQIYASYPEADIYWGWEYYPGTSTNFFARLPHGKIYFDAGGKCSDSLVPVSVEYYKDTAQADFTFTIGADGRTVTFDATNSVGNIYSWDFGDGTTGFGDTITHVYADSVDVYAICLEVEDTVCLTTDYYCDALVTTVGLDESSLASNVKLYPNPSMGNFNVSFTTAVESDYKIEIIDITGRTVNMKTGETKYGENKVLFDAGLPDGIYMVKVIVEGDVSTSRLVIRS